MRYISAISQIVFIAMLGILSGCASHKLYDLSATEPFSQYMDKDVILKRDIFLFEFECGAGPNYELCFADLNWDAPPNPTRRLLLPAGTHVQVMQTHLSYERQTIFQGFFGLTFLDSTAEIKLTAPAWPAKVNASFNNWSEGILVSVDPEDFEGTIRPAPWEPLDTPAKRRIPWPDDKYLVADKN
jgi:hypothetical protein